MIPSAIFSAELNNLEICAVSIDTDGFVFRTVNDYSADFFRKDLRKMYFYDRPTGKSETVVTENFIISEKEKSEFFTVYRFDTDDEKYSYAARKLMRQYSQYANLKLRGDDIQLAHRLLNYPKDSYKITDKTVNEWLTGVTANEIAEKIEGKEIGISLDNPALYRKYLSEKFLPYADFICVGSQFCPYLLPDEETLKSLFEKCLCEGKTFAFMLPYMKQSHIETYEKLLSLTDSLSRQNGIKTEVIANDFGIFEIAEKYSSLTVSAGILICKRRKDARLEYLKNTDYSLLSQTSSDDGLFRKYLEREYGITSFCYESPGYDIAYGNGRNTVFAPLYVTNTATYCPIYSLVKYGCRGIQNETKDCAHYCLSHTIQYPDSFNTMGIYNSLFAVDKDFEKRIEKADRVVINSLFSEVIL